MKRLVPLAVVAGLVSAATATALAAQGGGRDPYASAARNVTSGQVLRLPVSAPGCSAARSATARVNPPIGAVLGFVRIAVAGRQAARLTGVPRAASATVRIPRSGARLTVTGETLGGQRLHATRVYSDCSRPDTTSGGGGGGAGGGEG